MIIAEKRLVNFLRNNPIFTPQQAKILYVRGNKASKCMDCYCFKCTNECAKVNPVLLPFCRDDCEKPVSATKIKNCFEF
jgi:hypothetical protein